MSLIAPKKNKKKENGGSWGFVPDPTGEDYDPDP